ncbi:HU family DNA-binding protein (plasmid) [Methylomarinum sp. Ch1-1]|uniref:HU family DNA-binding protein n=1 Tax=Methylomarinum roseum TaxID=3067653 RepID=A0AAU7P082_9GAMM|nr:HU family DNA-binding protein [Methylomarinum sp. Ch1-1]MDP4523254.1 HU family DNA-binding protein [Methylomarinum sp. Ch1-1]
MSDIRKKDDLVVAVQNVLASQNLPRNLPKSAINETIQAVFETIANTLGKGERAYIHGFGTFEPTAREERQGRNPATGEEITIPASRSCRFKPSETLKKALNG